MEPTSLPVFPSTTSWYMNPFFMAAFGAVVAFGFVLFALAYFLFTKLKTGITKDDRDDKCTTCGLTADLLAKLGHCPLHSEMKYRVEAIELWVRSHEQDYRELRKKIDDVRDRAEKR